LTNGLFFYKLLNSVPRGGAIIVMKTYQETLTLDNAYVRGLVDAGVHFGHKVGRWNPKMQPYIFCARNSIHIINIKETMKGLLRSKRLLHQVVANGEDVLFVGTKRQARGPVQEHAGRCNMHFVTERWLGGILTNFRTIRSRLSRLEELEQLDSTGQLAAESKKMESRYRREQRKIDRNLGGIREMNKLPGLIVVVDARREVNALLEARKLGIPSIGLIDTDCDPDTVDLAIPANDDAMKSIDLIIAQLADSAIEAIQSRTNPDSATADDGKGKRRSKRASSSSDADELARQEVAPATEEPAAE
jgi:small subunit ribosomal protein S2